MRQLDAVLIIDSDDLHFELVADLADIADRLHEAFGQFADVAQAVLTGSDLDEGTEVLDRADGPVVDATHLDLFGDGFDAGESVFTTDLIGTRDQHLAVVGHVDLRLGLLLDRADVLSAGANQQADLFGIDLRLQDTWREIGDLTTRPTDRTEHHPQQFETGVPGSCERAANDLFVDAVDLQVELNPGDPLLGTGHLEVHIAEVIFVADDVGQQHVLAAFLDQTDRDSSHGLLNRNTGIHQTEGSAADGGHRAGTVRLGDVGDQADRVREDFGLRQHPLQRTLSESSVTEFTTTWSTNRLALTDRVGREVVIKHERLGEFAEQSIGLLLITNRTQHGRTERLRFTAGEDSRTVDAGQNADLAIDCTQSRQ